jgi:hypothetical protein
MSITRVLRLAGAVAVFAGGTAVALAQTAPPSPSPDTPSAKQDQGTSPQTAPTQSPAEKQAAEPGPPKVNPLIGLAVFSSDGSKLGTVHSVNAEPDGKVKAIHIKTGGFLGFGAKLVAIPENKFARTGDTIRLGVTADEVSKLPEVKEQS